jgi:MoCo/4Fe-4S cofactor protein with predicted Tat translocation signal
MDNDRHINFKLLRDRILGAGRADGSSAPAGKQYWRSLEELADSPIFEEFVQREFPQAAEEWNDPVERRTFLKLMGASLALAGVSGCVIQPPEKIVPYVKQPEEEVPGRGLYFATAFSLGGIATPLLARSNEGRPTKLEGNPDHPNNRNSDPNDKGSSATDIFSHVTQPGRANEIGAHGFSGSEVASVRTRESRQRARRRDDGVRSTGQYDLRLQQS